MNDLDLRLWQARFRDYMNITKGWSPRTVEAYSSELKPFFHFLERQGLTNVSRLTRTHLESYRQELFYLRVRDKPLARSTQSLRLTSILGFIRFLFRENYLLLDIAARFELPKIKETLPRTVLSEREALQLIEQPDINTPLGIRERAMLELFYGTGMRNSELRLLQIDQVDLERGLLRIDHGKGNKARVVPLGEEALVWLEEYLIKVRPQLVRSADQTLVFPGLLAREIPRGALAVLVRRLARKAGIEKVVTPHVLRHTCVTHMLRRGASVRHLQSLLGHACLNTTQRYTRVEISDLAKVIEQFHPREQIGDL
jgi:integrase/recombinase XerD